MRRSGFKRTPPKRKEGPTSDRLEHAIAPAKTLHRATMGQAVLTAVPKTEVKRNPALLEMARGRECLIQRVPGVCIGGTETTVACHSNLLAHGKGKARKADDQYSVWGCATCHRWLDQGWSEDGPTREAAFMAAHLRQVTAWRAIAADPSEPKRFRDAAQWALDQLNATPVPEMA